MIPDTLFPDMLLRAIEKTATMVRPEVTIGHAPRKPPQGDANLAECILALLREEGYLTSQDLAELSGMPIGKVKVAIATLIRRGAIIGRRQRTALRDAVYYSIPEQHRSTQ